MEIKIKVSDLIKIYDKLKTTCACGSLWKNKAMASNLHFQSSWFFLQICDLIKPITEN